MKHYLVEFVGDTELEGKQILVGADSENEAMELILEDYDVTLDNIAILDELTDYEAKCTGLDEI